MTATQAPARRSLLRRARALSPDQILFRQYKLTKRQKAVMYLRGAALSQLASPVSAAVYFLLTQVAYTTRYGTTTVTWLYLKDPWDRFPVHVQNLLHAHWFAGQVAPAWWVTARHDARHVFEGILIVLLIGSVTVGLSRKPRRRLSNRAIAARFALALPAAVPGAALGIGFFAWLLPDVLHVDISQAGLGVGGWLGEWIGKGSWQLTIIGILAGLGAKRVLTPAQDALQLISLEKKLAEGETPKRWWRPVYGPNYVNRYEYLRAERHECKPHGKVMGAAMTLAAPVFLFLLGFGIWLLYFGPAASGGH